MICTPRYRANRCRACWSPQNAAARLRAAGVGPRSCCRWTVVRKAARNSCGRYCCTNWPTFSRETNGAACCLTSPCPCCTSIRCTGGSAATTLLAAQPVAGRNWAAGHSSTTAYAGELIALVKDKGAIGMAHVGTVGIFSSPTQFYRRMEMLVRRKPPLMTTCTRRWRLLATLTPPSQ